GGIVPPERFAGSSSPDDREVLFAAVVEAVETAGQGGPLLLLIEDVHWADPPSLVLLRTLVDAAPSLPVALVLTARHDPFESSEAVRAALAELPTNVRRVAVPPLDDTWAARLVRGIAGQDLSATALSDVVSRTGGNPFFLTEVARLLVAQGPAGAVAVPPGV